MRKEVIRKVPAWAVCYLVNADDTALNSRERASIERWRMKLDAMGIQLGHPIRGSGSEFEPHPAFGGACGTVDFTAIMQ